MLQNHLSHHELVRYQYLMGNYNFLSKDELRELDYLTAKMGGHRHPNTGEIIDIYQDSQVEVSSSTRVAKTVKKKRKFPFFRWLFLCLSLVLLSMAGMFIKGKLAVDGYDSDIQPASTQVFNGQDTSDGINILILGTDQRPTEGDTDVRTDSIMVLNIGNSSGQPKLVSFMRDTLVHIQGLSYWTADSKINSAFTIGQQKGNLGAETVRQVLKDNFDLDISYYVMVDFETFATAIDTLFPEGIEIDAQFSTVDGEEVDSVEVPDDLGFASGGSLYQTIEVGLQTMDGKTLLNYARFRGDDSADFGRTQRQQQVLSAILSQIKDPTKLFTGSEALGKVYAMTSTILPLSFIIEQGLSNLLAGNTSFDQMTIPEQGNWLDTYDRYGGLGLSIDFDYYKQELEELGLR